MQVSNAEDASGEHGHPAALLKRQGLGPLDQTRLPPPTRLRACGQCADPFEGSSLSLEVSRKLGAPTAPRNRMRAPGIKEPQPSLGD